MKWREFKRIVESFGVTDQTDVIYIDCHLPGEDVDLDVTVHADTDRAFIEN